ncbi:DUF3800 domain-containing protein [Agrobacterium tumefaciens]|uniref:DUF3800 domain-containing protein n=1 Tax=Agrobacterium tumefaciens TaxID=358 RepID=UPI0015735493|nr:DUF3800 domain-containing protein [Agrobacterium tumefaciens]WCK21756.1 DUF3800 domain-containing protein [Agrobacterium tumefaciens]
MIDINEIRDPDILLYGLTGADEDYTIYYDETNNIRRLHVTPDGLNVREPKCFVLGGIAHQGASRDLGFAPLRSALRLQPSAKEMKLEHLGKGDFLQFLGSTKIGIFLDWLKESGLFLHFQVLDVMYWSIVDIVDSIVTEAGHVQLMMAAPALKDDLYTVLRYDLDHTVDLFKRFDYPDVGQTRRRAFVEELQIILEERRDLLQDFNFQMLKGLLQMAARLDTLPYLEDEEPNVLIEEFSMFYLKRICLFKNATHILDIEEVIKEKLTSYSLTDGGRTVRNYQFVNSRLEVGVQISDVVTGLLGKAFTYLNSTPMTDLQAAMDELSPVQARNLQVLTGLINHSIQETMAFANLVLSHEDRRRAAFLLDM